MSFFNFLFLLFDLTTVSAAEIVMIEDVVEAIQDQKAVHWAVHVRVGVPNPPLRSIHWAVATAEIVRLAVAFRVRWAVIKLTSKTTITDNRYVF